MEKIYGEEWLELGEVSFWTVVLEKILESPLGCKEIQPVHPKGDHPGCSLEGLMLKPKLNTLPTWCEELTHWKRPWCWERLRAGGEGDDRGWNSWMASPTLGVHPSHWVDDTIQPSHPPSSPSPPALNLSQHQGLFKWVSSSHQVGKVLEFHLQHQSFQWTPRTDLL